MINASDIEAFEYYNELDNNNILPTDYQTFIYKSRYSKWLPEKGRRENWSETVSRYMNNVVKDMVDKKVFVIFKCFDITSVNHSLSLMFKFSIFTSSIS